jgi:hypothetical protein
VLAYPITEISASVRVDAIGIDTIGIDDEQIDIGIGCGLSSRNRAIDNDRQAELLREFVGAEAIDALEHPRAC